MPGVPRATVLRLYDEGVDAIVAAAGALGPDGWSRVACGDWTASDLARHVLAVAQWYECWLDRAERGDAGTPLRRCPSWPPGTRPRSRSCERSTVPRR